MARSAGETRDSHVKGMMNMPSKTAVRSQIALGTSSGSSSESLSEHALPAHSGKADNGHSIHHHHEAIAKRLRRAEGHLHTVVQMIDSGRECIDIAQQLSAVEKAIVQAKKALIQDHLDHCLEDVVGTLTHEERRPIDEFKAITKYL